MGKIRSGAATLVAVSTVVLAIAAPAHAAAAAPGSPGAGHRYSTEPSKTKPFIPCFRNQGRLRANCNILIEPRPTKSPGGRWIAADGSLQEGSGVLGGWAPKDLQSAYQIPTTGGETQTIAVIDAFGDFYAEADMAKYREQYGLPPCTHSSGCFRKVNGSGLENNNPPEKSANWGLETSLDLDMASAACPKCHILLVQTFGELPAEMAAAVNTAAKLGATEISNSYGYPEKYKPWCPAEKGCSEYAAAYHHPGIAITASSGDYGYNNFELAGSFYDAETRAAAGAPDWPAASPDVIAVGGTELEQAGNARGWEEQSWYSSGSGCSLHQPKPAWQLDAKCPGRMGNDVAMVARNLSVYSTPYSGGWTLVGGTSASAPLLAGVLAHATQAVRDQGAEAFYTHRLVDIVAGGPSSKLCEEGPYLCRARNGYDGPTGWGVPSGALEATTGLPPATTEPTNITATSATLNGWVNPEGTETTYSFEYGPTKSYGTSVPASPAAVGAGTVWKPVSQNVSLAPGVYHYRLAATNKYGTRYGGDQVLTLSRWKEEEPTWLQNSEEYYFTGVSCSSTSTCMTVFSLTNIFAPPLPGVVYPKLPWPAAEQVQGTSWEAPVNLPRPAGEVSSGELQGLSCPSAEFCQGVGWYQLEGGGRWPLAERWNGTAWEVSLSGALPEAGSAVLNGVSCASASSCMAVGSYWKNAEQFPLAEVWNGTTWTNKSPKTPFGSEEAVLTGVSCPAAGNCVASGFACSHFCPGGTRKTLIERWTGSWTVEPTPNEGVESNELYGISCPTTSVCTAVGQSSVIDGGWQNTLAERLENGVWSIQATPNPTHYNSLGNERCQAESGCGAPVSCPSVTECVATLIDEGEEEMLPRPKFARWDGGRWQLQDAREPSYLVGPREAELHSVSCPAAGKCLGVGRVGTFYTALNIGGGFKIDLWIAERLNIKIPIVNNVKASEVKATEALLTAEVNPLGHDARYQFEYGETAAYGNSIPVPSFDLGSGFSTLRASQRLTGLRPGTQYHFRVVVTGEEGSTQSLDGTFTTGAKVLWRACTKQAGGRFATSECAKEGSPNEWESLLLSSGQKTSITANGTPIAFTSTQSGVKLAFSCETEVVGASLENPSNGASGVGSAEVKYKGCKPEGLAAEKNCRIENTTSYPSSLELLSLEGKSLAILKPVGANPFFQFNIAGCSVTALNHVYTLTGAMRGLYSNGASKIEFTSESTGAGGLFLFGQQSTAVGAITLQASGGGAIKAEPRLLWRACTKQAGGRFATSECAKEGAPNEWESLLLSSGQKTSITANGTPIAFTSTQSGVKLAFSCETEVAGASLENPSAGSSGLGNAEVKYKGCKPEGLAAEKSCSVQNTANSPSSLELLSLEGKSQVILKPIGTNFAQFTISGCAIGAWNHVYQLTGAMRGVYSNGASKIEFTSESSGEGGLLLFGQKATAAGAIALQSSGGGAIRGE